MTVIVNTLFLDAFLTALFRL